MRLVQELDLDRQVEPFNRNRLSARVEGAEVLDLVHQAADLLQNIEDRAAATQACALEIAQQAAEQLQSAESRIRELQSEARAANVRANEAEQMLRAAQSEIAAWANRLSTTQERARNAEARVIEAEKMLIKVEDAIRNRLLSRRQSLAAAA
jgi:hypothetical protein